MRFVADRFVVNDDRSVEDLATGALVRLELLEPACAIEEARWIQRCATRWECPAPRTARLIDYGFLGAGRRFEAFARRTNRDVEPTGQPVAPCPAGLDLLLDDILEGGSRPGLRPMILSAPTERTLGAVWVRVARLARLHGFVPLLDGALRRHPGVARAIMSRHVLLFQRQTTAEFDDRAARLLLALGRLSSRPHIVLFLRVVDGFGAVSLTSIRDGRGPFVGDHTAGDTWSRAAGTVVVAERPSSFGSGLAAPGSMRIIRSVGRGLTDARSGRAARGERRLRQAIGALDRRGDTERAGHAALALGQLLLVRGHAAAARTAFAGACHRFEAAGRVSDLAAAQVHLGLALTDEARLRESEAVLRAADLVARDRDRPGLRCLIQSALARCLLWQGRIDEGRIALEEGGDNGWSTEAHGLRIRARLALAVSDLPLAGRLARAALTLPSHTMVGVELARSHGLVAAIEARAGNLDGLRRHVDLGLRVAGEARAHGDVWRLRSILVEGLRHSASRGAARSAARRLARRRIDRCPNLLRARVSHALAMALPDDPRAMAWRQFAHDITRSEGVAGLNAGTEREPRMDIVAEVVEVLNICQEDDDEASRLAAACRAVKDRLGSLSVSLIGGEPPSQVILAEAGRARSGRAEIAARIVDTGLAIPPISLTSGLEAGAPVRYGGVVIGALICRWTPDRSVESSRVEALLTTAAAACAPSVRSALDRLSTPKPETHAGDLDIVGVSAGAEELRAAVRRAAAAPFPVVIVGESGSGKELVAKAIHRAGLRRNRRLAALNCAALNDELVEAELFGHTRGAFSGALQERLGVFEDADGGTLFLDEVSELSTRAQAKLLRALQEGEIRRVGENIARRVDVRLVTATNRDLWGDVETGRFRRDLLYRLDVIRIVVPPLRDRVEDIALLASHFWSQSTQRLGSRATLSPEVLGALARHDWPGNVRELQNVMAALAVDSPLRGRVGGNRLADALARAGIGGAAPGPARTLAQARRLFERRFVRAALAREGGHQARAASALGLTRQGLAKLLTRLESGEAPDAASPLRR